MSLPIGSLVSGAAMDSAVVSSADGAGWHAHHFYGRPGALVTSVRIETNGSPHAHITVWTLGGCAGTLTVDRADADGVALRLLNPADRVEEGSR